MAKKSQRRAKKSTRQAPVFVDDFPSDADQDDIKPTWCFWYNLPLELVHDICEQCDRQDIAALSRVSRKLHKIFSPILYASVEIKAYPKTYQETMKRLVRTPKRRIEPTSGRLALIRALRISFSGWETRPYTSEGAYYLQWNHLEDLAALVSKSNEIQKFYLEHNGEAIEHPERVNPLEKAICDSTSLRHLAYLYNEPELKYHPPYHDCNITFLKQLFESTELESLAIVVSDSMKTRALNLPINSHLSTLCLINSYFSDGAVCQIIAAAPSLKHLALRLQRTHQFVDLPLISQSIHTLKETLETFTLEFQFSTRWNHVKERGKPLRSMKDFSRLRYLAVAAETLLGWSEEFAVPLADLLPPSLLELDFLPDFDNRSDLHDQGLSFQSTSWTCNVLRRKVEDYSLETQCSRLRSASVYVHDPRDPELSVDRTFLYGYPKTTREAENWEAVNSMGCRQFFITNVFGTDGQVIEKASESSVTRPSVHYTHVNERMRGTRTGVTSDGHYYWY